MCFVNNNVDSVIVENTESISDKLFIHGKPLRISQPVVNNYVTDIVFLHKFFKCVLVSGSKNSSPYVIPKIPVVTCRRHKIRPTAEYLST